MSNKPALTGIEQALQAASQAHHEYEQNALHGNRDEQWAGWYAAYVLGRLGEFTSPSALTQWLESAPSEGDWSKSAASFVMEKLG